MKATRFAGVGLAWAVSNPGLFMSNTTKSVESRLRQIGYRPPHLYLDTLVMLSGAQRGVRASSRPGSSMTQ